MCGIVGYIGEREPYTMLLDGLRRLEYRGYDSCGVAVFDNGVPKLIRTVGKIENLAQKMRGLPPPVTPVRCGIAHTRWATHGKPSEENAHPHRDCKGQVFVVHNGIVENYQELRQKLVEEGHCLKTDTDTEVLPHLIESYFQGNLEQAVSAALRHVRGVYGLVAMSLCDSLKIVAARNGPPIVVGLGQGENFVASDVPALLPYARDVVFLNDGELAVIRRNSIELLDPEGKAVSRAPQHIPWSADLACKDGYPHFMLKEIFEQPRALRDTLRGRVTRSGMVCLQDELGEDQTFSSIRRVQLVACGTSLHAALVGKFLIESLARLPVDVDYASEFRYRNPLLDPATLVVAITQSGETADTLAALREGREKGASLLSICNVAGSMAARQSDYLFLTHAGPEIGVASTKAFTAQLLALHLLALFLAQARNVLPSEHIRRQVQLLQAVPGQVERALGESAAVERLAERLQAAASFLYLGRGINFPVALEGALKLKEISYIHAEGYPAAEMKHGPIALVTEQMPVVVVIPEDPLYSKTMSNLEEIKVRDGIVVAVATDGDAEIARKADHVLPIPSVDPLLNPLVGIVPLQLLAYHTGVLRGCDVDMPRNLAKSVTVE